MAQRSVVAVTALLLAACASKDTTPPPPPQLDDAPASTALSSMRVTGTAEYGSKVAVQRTAPALGADEALPDPVVANPYTARFEMVLPLALASDSTENDFSFTATDAAGNVSAVTALKIVRSKQASVQVANLAVNGALCTLSGAPAACAVGPNDTIDFDLIAFAAGGISELDVTAYFSSTGTVFSRQVLIAANTPVPITYHFSFDVPGGALPEDVSLVGLGVDLAGNRISTVASLLRVSPYRLFGGRVATVAARGGLVSAPQAVLVDAAGTMLIGNDGRGDLLKLAVGAPYPQIYSVYSGGTSFLTADSAGNLFVADGNQITRIPPDGTTVGTWLTLPGGANATGFGATGPTPSKGLVNAASAQDGDKVHIGTIDYQLNLGAGCTPSATNVCVTVGSSNVNQALVTALAGSTVVNASFAAAGCGGTSNGTSGCAVLSAKSAGASGNSVALSTTAAARIAVSGTSLQQGHDEDLWVGSNGFDNNVYRYPAALVGNPTLPSGSVGTYNVGRGQFGLAVRDFTTAASANLRDLTIYVADANSRTLTGYNATQSLDALAVTQTFAVNSVTAGASFGRPYAVKIEPTTGCLLVSDSNRGNVYTVDVRTRGNNTPPVALVIAGLTSARGLAFDANGNLYVADSGTNSIVKITPAGAGGCF
jgi:hypothetical protein